MTDSDFARRALSARAMRLGGGLLWLAGAIHFAAFPLLRHTIASRLTPEAFAFAWPPFALSFLLDGILLLPLGFTAIYSANGILRGERWATVLGLSTAIVVLVLPIVLWLVLGGGYFAALPLLIATIVILGAGLAMILPLVHLARHAAAG